MSAIDLVERLRARKESVYDHATQGAEWQNDALCIEAADTITRLQAALTDARGCLEGTQSLIKAMSGRESIAIETAIERIDAALSSVGGE